MQSTGEHNKAKVAAYSGAVVNVGLTVFKGVIGFLTGSRALLADAVHSAADVVGSVAVIVGLRIARKPPDKEHPYGHGKAELISSAVVGGFLIAAAVEVGYDSIKSLFATPTRPHALAAYTAAVAIIVKEILFQYTYRLGKKLNSKSLLASAYDHRSDVLSSAAALVGILLSLLGEWKHIRILLYMDGVAGALVAILVLKMAIKISVESISTLMDKVLEGEDLHVYADFINKIPGVEHIDELRVRDHGQYFIVDVKLSVDATITVAAGHEIAGETKRKLIETFPRVLDVLVHVNPYYPGDIGNDELGN